MFSFENITFSNLHRELHTPVCGSLCANLCKFCEQNSNFFKIQIFNKGGYVTIYCRYFWMILDGSDKVVCWKKASLSPTSAPLISPPSDSLSGDSSPSCATGFSQPEIPFPFALSLFHRSLFVADSFPLRGVSSASVLCQLL